MAQSGESNPFSIFVEDGLMKNTRRPESADGLVGGAKGGASSKKRPALSDISNFHSDVRNTGGEKGKAVAARSHRATTGDDRPERNASGLKPSDTTTERPASRTEGSRPVSKATPPSFYGSDIDLDPMAIENDDSIDVVEDIDAPDAGKHLLCPEIAMEVFDHTWQAQTRHRPLVNYMDVKQRDINANMRAILMDWLVEVAEEYKLVPDTLFLSVAYADRYLSHTSVVRGKLQLVGVTAMLIAAKFEEVYPPAVDEFVYISDNTYTRDEIIFMEQKILKALDFNLHMVTPRSFIRRYQKAAAPLGDIRFENLTNFILELTLLEYGFLKYYPSVIAASAVCYALHTLDRPCWSRTLAYYTKHTFEDIKDCVRDMHAVYSKGVLPPNPSDRNPLGAIRDKYSRSKFHRVSTTIPVQEDLPSYP